MEPVAHRSSTPLPFHSRVSKRLSDLFSPRGLVASFLIHLSIANSVRIEGRDPYGEIIRNLENNTPYSDLARNLRRGRNCIAHSKMFSLELLRDIIQSLAAFNQHEDIAIGNVLSTMFEEIYEACTPRAKLSLGEEQVKAYTFTRAKEESLLTKGTQIRIETGNFKGTTVIFRGWCGTVCKIELLPSVEGSQNVKSVALKHAFSFV